MKSRINGSAKRKAKMTSLTMPVDPGAASNSLIEICSRYRRRRVSGVGRALAACASKYRQAVMAALAGEVGGYRSREPAWRHREIGEMA